MRQKEIRFSSRTRAATDDFKKSQLLRRAVHHLLQRLPDDLRQLPQANLLAGEADEKVYNIINLIYHSHNYEGTSKDYEFSRRTMEEHWESGYNDAVRTLRHPEVLKRPEKSRWCFHLRPCPRRTRIKARQAAPGRSPEEMNDETCRRRQKCLCDAAHRPGLSARPLQILQSGIRDHQLPYRSRRPARRGA